LIWIFFFYGLAFFSMGLAIVLEMGHGSDPRLKHALRPMAIFGLIHGGHEWMEMFEKMDLLPVQLGHGLEWDALRIAILALSFLALGAFGASLLSPDERARRLSLLVPLGQALLWGGGLLIMRGRYALETDLLVVAEVWTRYVLAVLGALLASAGLMAQQRAFQRAGMAQFSRDSMWAAVAFAWYGAVGQVFTRASPLPPSNWINQDLFLEWFGFPVQLLRAMAAIAVAVFVIRFLRSSEVETQRHIASLQAARLEEAQRRQALRGELLQRVVTAQETERQRIARELHDEAGQALTAVGLGLRASATTLRQDPDRTERILRHLEELVAYSLEELQRLVANLRPSHLDDLGLAAALRWYGSQLQERSSLEVDVEVSGEERRLPSAVATALFRVGQEALTNVVKHAGATRAHLALRFGPDRVSLVVEDDGVGFDPLLLENSGRSRWGLLGMEERASSLGGQLMIRPGSSRGMRIEVNVPMEMESEGGDGDTTVARG
jgi:signal transduction histidine kinase